MDLPRRLYDLAVKVDNALDGLKVRVSALEAGGVGGGPVGDIAIADVDGLTEALDGKQPSGSYSPTSHNHDGTYQPVGLYLVAADLTWANISGKPATFAPSAHSHVIADVTGLQTALDGKQAAGSYAPLVHSHPISDITGLQTALDGKQVGDATLTALAGLNSTAGLVEQTGADAFTKRAMGVGATTSVLTRADGDGRYQLTDATLTALAGLDATAGLLEQTGADAFVKRSIGVGATTSIPTRADGDARWQAIGSYQPLDSDLTSIAALTTTAFGRGFLDLADAAAARTKLALGSAATSNSGDFQPSDADLTAIAALTTTAFGRGFLDLADAAAARTKLALGTAAQSAVGDFQAADSDLAAIAALATTAYGRALLTLADAAALTAAANTFTSALKGLAPASGGGTVNFLRADGTWAPPPGGGVGGGDAYLANDQAFTGVNTFAGIVQAGTNLVRIENTNAALPTGASGLGLELSRSSITVYNRSTFSYGALTINAASIDLAIGGVNALSIDSSGNASCAGVMTFAYSASPPTPVANWLTFAPQRLNAAGGRVWPRWRSEEGVNITVATHQGRNTVAWGQAIGNATTAIAPIGMAALTTVGTATARNVASTSRLTRAKRLAYVSAATAGAAAGLFNGTGNTQFAIGGAAGGGFLSVFRFAVSDASLVSGAHAFVGMRSSTATPNVTNSPASLTNVIGLAQNNGSANWFVVYGGSAAQTSIDTGIAINNTDLFEFTLYARPDVANKVTWRLENITTGAVASGELTGVAGTALPANTTFLGPVIWRSNNATAAAVGIDIVSFYLESDIA